MCDADARFLVVGGYAVGVHGYPRATKDLDVWVEASEQNASKVIAALRAFGAPLMGISETDLLTPRTGLRIGVEPGRVDVRTKVAGVEFATAWTNKIEALFGDVRAHVIGLADLMTNKRAAARPQDLADVAALDRLGRAKARKGLRS
ncbi:MAG TPA: DUF6036 family nucleotidyltransferase [Polyangiaceae bacterium]|nr:DUF6036 family nucleotidyltransferase [Polyangiaceae bacterium]